MDLITIIFEALLLIALICAIWLTYRNQKFMDFQVATNETMFNNMIRKVAVNKNYDLEQYDAIKHMMDDISTKMMYFRFMALFKPFKLENYFTEEEINIIKGNYEL